jgi:hypothetical protein
MTIKPLTLENSPRPIEEGDVGLVLTKTGGFFLFNAHAKADLDPANMTERQLEQGRIIDAFSVALRLPAVMDVLFQVANDPAVVGDVVVDYGVAN